MSNVLMDNFCPCFLKIYKTKIFILPGSKFLLVLHLLDSYLTSSVEHHNTYTGYKYIDRYMDRDIDKYN